ncbi:hypothetical protein D3C81_970610 [compost metagenome]
MCPPLMCNLMGCYRVGIIDRIFLLLIDISNKTDRFGKRNCICKGLRESSRCARKFNNTQLSMRVSTVFFRIVSQRSLTGSHHPIEVIGMPLMVINLQINPVPLIFFDFIFGRIKSKKVQDFRIHFILIVLTTIFFPLFCEIARSNSQLILGRTYCSFKTDPIGIVGYIVILQSPFVSLRSHSIAIRKSILFADIIIYQLAPVKIAYIRKKHIVDKCTIALHRRFFIYPGIGRTNSTKFQHNRIARSHRLLEFINVEIIFIVGRDQLIRHT